MPKVPLNMRLTLRMKLQVFFYKITNYVLCIVIISKKYPSYLLLRSDIYVSTYNCNSVFAHIYKCWQLLQPSVELLCSFCLYT